VGEGEGEGEGLGVADGWGVGLGTATGGKLQAAEAARQAQATTIGFHTVHLPVNLSLRVPRRHDEEEHIVLPLPPPVKPSRRGAVSRASTPMLVLDPRPHSSRTPPTGRASRSVLPWIEWQTMTVRIYVSAWCGFSLSSLHLAGLPMMYSLILSNSRSESMTCS
jgi:hypothetical protein